MAASKKGSMQAQAYEFIRNKIAMCEYAPNQMLSESLLQEDLGFSRTPVREAISRLAQEGLLKVFPKRGIVVSGFTFSDINMIYEVRMMVEPYTLRHYGAKLDPDEVARFAKAFYDRRDEMLDEHLFQLDDEFHSLLISALPNNYLRDLYTRIQTQNIRLRVMSGHFTENRSIQTTAEHLQITDACLAQDWEAAAEAMTRHLQCSRASSLAAILQSDINTQII